jgi:hypothetical protein
MKPSATKTMTRLTTFARAANRQGSIATRSIAGSYSRHSIVALSAAVMPRKICRRTNWRRKIM